MENPVVIPNLVRKVTELFAIDKEHQIDALDDIKAIAFGDGIIGSSIDQEPWKDQWWHELQTASFPRKTVSQLQIYNCPTLSLRQYLSHKVWHQKLLDRLRSARHLTQLAHDKNTNHLDIRAMELNQLSKGYEMMNSFLMPDSSEREKAMEDMYQRESEGGKHPL
jgi:hypothetical protein